MLISNRAMLLGVVEQIMEAVGGVGLMQWQWFRSLWPPVAGVWRELP